MEKTCYTRKLTALNEDPLHLSLVLETLVLQLRICTFVDDVLIDAHQNAMMKEQFAKALLTGKNPIPPKGVTL